MNFEDYLSYCTMSKAVVGVLVYAAVLIQISLASSAGPCGGVRGRFICDDNDPQVFHICMGNQKYTNRCPGDLHYNVRTQTCDWPKAVNCVEEARRHARRMSSGEIKVPDLAGASDENNAVDSNEDVYNLKQESKGNSINVPTKKLKNSFEQNPKVQNKQILYPDALDVDTMQQDNVFTKSEEVDLPVKVNKDDSDSGQIVEINIKNRSSESKDKLDSVTVLNGAPQKEQLNESIYETTTPVMITELDSSKPIESDIVGHMIETYKSSETPEVFLYTRPVPRQRNRRPSMSPYKKSQIVNTTKQPITTRRSVTSANRQLTTATPVSYRQPVTTSGSPFRKTTVVYHPFLTNRTKPDYREYAPQLTTRRPSDNRQSKDRSKWSPQISAAPYRSATNYADDITDTPKWYELGDDKKTTVSKPESNSYGNSIGKSLSKNSIERNSGEDNKDLDYTEDNSEKPLTSTKSSSLSWVKSSTNSFTTGQTFAAPDALEKVRNALRSRNFRDHRLKTTSAMQESQTTPFAEEVNKNIKRFKPKTPLAQAWINERKGHFINDYENQESGNPFKKNRWYSTERLSTTVTTRIEDEKVTSPETRDNTEVTKEPTYTTRSHSSKTPSWTLSRTSMYSTDARVSVKQIKSTASINAAAALNDREEGRQKVTEINSVQEATPRASNKLPWWSMGTNRDTSVAPVHQHDVGEHQQNPFYRRAYLPRHSGARRPNYHTRTPVFDTDSSDQSQEKSSLLYKPNDHPSKPKERSFDLLKVNSDSESERRFSLHRNYGPQINSAESEDRTFALHKAKNRATNQYSAAAAADRRPGANGAVNAPASSDQITIDATRTDELAKNIDDKNENKNPIEKYEFKKGKCSSSWCKLPDCRCVGSDIPGELDAKDIPQMVMLTFDDSINSQNMGYYKTIFNGTLKNPNGCPIKSTFYVSGDNSDYEMVRKMHKGGHEIASHTLSHRSPTTWWADAGYDNWEQEVIGMKKRLNEKSGVPLKEITGMRAPFLQVGGDAQYAMLKENKFRYDTSMVTGNLYVNNEPPTWPFTLDTPPDSRTCSLTPCPTRSYPGLWEVPLIRWYGSNKIACAMPDACTIGAGTKGSRKFIEDNFMRHYTTNRAPFGIFIHASWFGRKDGNIEGLVEFLASLADKKDVWVVSVSQALDWIQKPVRLSAINALDSWMC